MKFWLEEFETNSKKFDENLPKKPILVLGNKSDFDVKFKQISTEELEKFAEENKTISKEVSAKKNSGKEIQNAINGLIDLIANLGLYIYYLTKKIKVKNLD